MSEMIQNKMCKSVSVSEILLILNLTFGYLAALSYWMITTSKIVKNTKCSYQTIIKVT